MLDKKLLVSLIIIFSFDSIWCRLSCKNEDNSPVDWFIALKYPDKYDFVYLVPNASRWTTSSVDLYSSRNMIGLTLEQSYNPKYFYAYYNDEPVKSKSWETYRNEKGHLKGVINFDQSSGYWLIHSVPKFPSAGEYAYLDGERRFGQSFICVSLGSKTLLPIVLQLLMMYPNVYSYHIPRGFSKDSQLMKNLNLLVKNKKTNGSDSFQLSLSTTNGVALTHFGKSSYYDKDLYDSFIAPSLKTSIYVESWIRTDRIDSSCNRQYKVFNVKEVTLTEETFRETKDHSKWATSTSSDRPWICVGDINRMTSQFVRGGGSLCMSDINVWTMYKTTVADYEKCGRD